MIAALLTDLSGVAELRVAADEARESGVVVLLSACPLLTVTVTSNCSKFCCYCYTCPVINFEVAHTFVSDFGINVLLNNI